MLLRWKKLCVPWALPNLLRLQKRPPQNAVSYTHLQEVCNLVRFGVPFKQVIKSATINPAREIHEDANIGSIKVGKRADLVVLDNDLNIKMVIARCV